MKIHLNQIPVEGLHVEGEEDRDILEIQDPLVHPLKPVYYSVDVGLSEGGLFATGTVGVDLEMECVVCLERFKYELVVSDFAVQVELGTPELVDLTEFVREDILLALPPHPHCDWNGSNTCSGVRTVAITREQEVPEDAEGENPWKTLDQLTKPKD